MKNSKVKKSIAVLTAAVLTMSVQSFVLAAEEREVDIKDNAIITPKNIAINDTVVSISKNTSTNLNCYAKTRVIAGYSAKTIVELQQYNAGWTTIKTWTATGGTTTVVDENYNVTSGYSYCIKVTHKAYNSAGVEVESITEYDYI